MMTNINPFSPSVHYHIHDKGQSCVCHIYQMLNKEINVVK